MFFDDMTMFSTEIMIGNLFLHSPALCYGLRLPKDETSMLYVQVRFRWNSELYTYPIACIRSCKCVRLAPGNADQAIGNFVQNFVERCPSICRKPIVLTNQDKRTLAPVPKLYHSTQNVHNPNLAASSQSERSGVGTQSQMPPTQMLSFGTQVPCKENVDPSTSMSQLIIPQTADKFVPSFTSKIRKPLKTQGSTGNATARDCPPASVENSEKPKFVPTFSPACKKPVSLNEALKVARASIPQQPPVASKIYLPESGVNKSSGVTIQKVATPAVSARQAPTHEFNSQQSFSVVGSVENTSSVPPPVLEPNLNPPTQLPPQNATPIKLTFTKQPKTDGTPAKKRRPPIIQDVETLVKSRLLHKANIPSLIEFCKANEIPVVRSKAKKDELVHKVYTFYGYDYVVPTKPSISSAVAVTDINQIG